MNDAQKLAVKLAIMGAEGLAERREKELARAEAEVQRCVDLHARAIADLAALREGIEE